MDWALIEKLAVALNVKRSTVAMWKSRGWVPAREHLRLLDAAEAAGVEGARAALGLPAAAAAGDGIEAAARRRWLP